ELENAAQFLFMASAGIPRTIVGLLIDHPTYSGFVEFVKNGHDLTLRLEDWEEVYRNILLWQSTLLEWIGKDIDECPTINMFDSVEDNEGKEVQPTLVLGSCYLNWEGTMDRAHVFADQTIWHVAIGILRPLQQYVRGLAKALPFMTAEHPEILEWLILKRVKELFTEETTPKKMLPSFFGKVTCFDLVEGINISKYVDVLPQITTGCEYDSQNVSTSTNTDRPSDKPMLMEYILNRLWIEQIPYDQGLCFKSIYKPSPADVIFVAQRNCSFMSEPKPKKRRNNSTKHIFFFGLTVLNCTTGKHDIVEECAKFDKMLQELHQMRDTLGSVTTSGVLVLGAAKYTREIQRSFRRRDSVVFTTPQVCQNVEQVLLLNLSTPELRARFFGFEDEPALKRTVEDIFLRSGSA
ncbi:Crinkler (CRN), partial [Phytophthora megakarya]